MLGSIKAYVTTAMYPRMGQGARDSLRLRRLASLAKFAQARSPLYARLFKAAGVDAERLFGGPSAGTGAGTGVGADADASGSLRLQELPPTNKKELMAQFDDWLTDREVAWDGVASFSSDIGNVGKLYLKKCLVTKTSGTTDVPVVVLQDRLALAAMDAIGLQRGIARKEDIKAYMGGARRMAGVYINYGFHMGNNILRRDQRAPGILRKGESLLVDAAAPINEIVESLNEFQPTLLNAFPSILELLSDEQAAGRLRISPALVSCSGEQLTDKRRERLESVFGCYVQASYICTESGIIASECVFRRYHVNDDWVVVEPVDGDGGPVPEGQYADRFLVTYLANRIQPFIRYEITDRVALHAGGSCPCKNLSPWLELDGRTEGLSVFDAPGGAVRLPSLVFKAALFAIDGLHRFQVILRDGRDGDVVVLRLDADDRAAAFAQAKATLGAKLAACGVNADIRLSGEPPQISMTKKHKYVVDERREAPPP